jgi:hypothetical protein
MQFESELEWQLNVSDSEQLKVDIRCHKAEILVINEQLGGYVPMFCSSLCDFTFSKDKTDCQARSLISFSAGLEYFNAVASCYEPAVEPFPVLLDINTIDYSEDTLLKLPQPVNVNFTIGLVTCLGHFQKLWDESALQPVRLQPRNEHSSATNLISYGLGTMPDEDRCSPYAIRNLTELPIYFYNLDQQGKVLSYTAERVEPGAVKKLMLSNKGPSKMDLFVKLAFADLAAQPVARLNLNTSDKMLLHYVAKPTPERLREPVVLHSHLESNQRLLTVRT